MKHGGNVWEGGSPAQWLDFSANLRPEGIPEWVLHTMQATLPDARYYPDRAMQAARRGIAAYAGCPEEWVIPTPGGASAIDLVLSDNVGRVLLRPPTFGEYAERAAVHRRRVCTDEGIYRPGDTLVICNPNNPTGEAIPREKLLSLADTLRESGAELVADEAFADYSPESSVRQYVRAGLTVVGSLTKILCIPGVRLGYICACPERIARLQEKILPWSLNALAVAVAAELPNHIDEMAEDRRRNALRREAMRGALAEMGVAVSDSAANFLLCRFDRSAAPLAVYLKTQNILVRTCASFNLDDRYLRLAVKTEAENARLLAHIARWLQTDPSKEE